jgi:hypothetical protein
MLYKNIIWGNLKIILFPDQGERGQPGKDAEVPSLAYLDNLAEKTVHEVMDKV